MERGTVNIIKINLTFRVRYVKHLRIVEVTCLCLCYPYTRGLYHIPNSVRSSQLQNELNCYVKIKENLFWRQKLFDFLCTSLTPSYHRANLQHYNTAAGVHQPLSHRRDPIYNSQKVNLSQSHLFASALYLECASSLLPISDRNLWHFYLAGFRCCGPAT